MAKDATAVFHGMDWYPDSEKSSRDHRNTIAI